MQLRSNQGSHIPSPPIAPYSGRVKHSSKRFHSAKGSRTYLTMIIVGCFPTTNRFGFFGMQKSTWRAKKKEPEKKYAYDNCIVYPTLRLYVSQYRVLRGEIMLFWTEQEQEMAGNRSKGDIPGNKWIQVLKEIR